MSLKDSIEATSFADHNMLCRWPQLLVAPPQRELVEGVLRLTGVRIKTWHHVGPPFFNAETGNVEIGWPFSERVWAALCGYLAAFEWYQAAGHPEALDAFINDSTKAGVLELFEWSQAAAAEVSQERRAPWPQRTPQPPAPPAGMLRGISKFREEVLLAPDLVKTFEGRVSRAWQRATAWALFHEIGHRYFGHGTSPANEPPPRHVAINWEQQADHFASQIVFPTEVRDAEEQLAVLGVVGILVMLASHELGKDEARRGPNSPLHPLLRLRRFLVTFRQPGDLAWTAASVFLTFDRAVQGLAPVTGSFGTDRHLAEIYRAAGGPVVEM